MSALAFGSPEANALIAAQPLQHCPFCASTTLSEHFDAERGVFWVQCEECGAIGPQVGQDMLARRLWNGRRFVPVY